MLSWPPFCLTFPLTSAPVSLSSFGFQSSLFEVLIGDLKLEIFISERDIVTSSMLRDDSSLDVDGIGSVSIIIVASLSVSEDLSDNPSSILRRTERDFHAIAICLFIDLLFLPS